MNSAWPWLKRAFWLMIFAAVCLALCVAWAIVGGCSFASNPITSAKPSWDQSSYAQNSGVIGVVLPDGSELLNAAALAHRGPVSAWIMSPAAVARYNWLGVRFSAGLGHPWATNDGVVPRRDLYFQMNNAAMADFATFERICRRSNPAFSAP